MNQRTLALLLACALPAAGALAQAVDALPQAVEALPLPAAPPPAAAEAPPRTTWDLQTSRSALTAGLPDGEAQNLRGAITMAPGHVLQIDALNERKFGARGGVLAVAYTGTLSERWYLTHTLAAGTGGPNWANARTDLQVSRKWLSQGQLVTSLAVYKAWFDNDRSDLGSRLSLAWYLPGNVVLEHGMVFNVSQPGDVASHMPYAAITVGREGWQYFSVRGAKGTEAYQAVGDQAQLVDFRSSTVAFGWRRWIGRTWGFTFQDEYYKNPSYRRRTLGIGLFAQF
ncbi:YaiO family outer membrane beta-barrel protein [Pseudorhodoferax sp. Leaf267]|uniref:YaiO family outer membrane beta-barrel protein n=1 Tax=Pseudorhodoferax sp. Leaf267 TaxID=1736316 RepID=UPI0006F446DE|nr:YaiO family outer membrane beta-barrel protein [Pseudorhodoferax sp. Leaf267]KQP13103.1 hypothetical protein ASF43_18490 [Pseudorhodoferax sp. Leaf267]